MKKLMFAAAAIAAGVAFADTTGIVSQNIVGYENLSVATTDDGYAKYPMFGATFFPVAEDAEHPNQFRLGNITVTGMNAAGDEKLYRLQAADATPDVTSDLIYCDLASAMALLETEDPDEAAYLVGWWSGTVSGEDENRADDFWFVNGTAFLGYLEETHDIKFNCAGEANNVSKNVDISNKVYPMFDNPVPKTITLSEVTVTGLNAAGNDKFYKLLVADATPDTESDIIYCDLASAMALLETEDPDEAAYLVGWWAGTVSGEDENRCDTREVKPSESFIGYMEGNDNVVVNFPSAF